MRPSPIEMNKMLRADEVSFRVASVEGGGGGARGKCDLPPIDECSVKWKYPDEPALLVTWRGLEDWLEIDRDLQKRWESWDEAEGENLNWFESARDFVNSPAGFATPLQCRDNTYNYESDLDQDFVFEVYCEDPDWMFFDESTVLVIFMHVGTDARCGYGRPLFCRPLHETVFPDFKVEYDISEARRSGVTLDYDDMDALDEDWRVGMTSHPWYEVENDVARWFKYGDGGAADGRPAWPALLKTGEICLIAACEPIVE